MLVRQKIVFRTSWLFRVLNITVHRRYILKETCTLLLLWMNNLEPGPTQVGILPNFILGILPSGRQHHFSWPLPVVLTDIMSKNGTKENQQKLYPLSIIIGHLAVNSLLWNGYLKYVMIIVYYTCLIILLNKRYTNCCI